ncbi:MAG: glycerophosphodiester phosphodiesterase [Nocardioides sp.]
MKTRALAGLLVAAGLAVPTSGGASAQLAASCPPGFANVAHRGPHATTDENTISSIALAGAHGIELELDVRQDRQGQEWLHHDATLDRTTNGTGLFVNKSTAHIESLRTEPRGQEIPTLNEALTAAAGYESIEKIYLDLWSKNPTDDFINDVVDEIEAAGLEDRTYIVKFHPRVNRVAPHILLQWKPPAGTTVAQMLAKNVEGIAGPQGMLTATMVQELRAGGIDDVVMMSVNKEPSLLTALTKGVDGVMGDSPFVIKSSCGF